MRSIKAITIPLVLHGGSSSGDENLEKMCTRRDPKKSTSLQISLQPQMTKIQEQQPADYFELKKAANQGMADTLAHYYHVFHTKNLLGG